MAQRKMTVHYLEGMNTYTSDLLMKNSDINLLLNGYFSKVGVIKTRGGITFKGDRQGTGNILGIHAHYTGLSDGSGGYKKYMYQVSTVSGTTAIKRYTSGTDTWTALSGGGTSLTDAEDYEFANFLNYAFVVNPSDAPRVIDGSDGATVSTSTNLTNAPAYARHVATYFNRVYMADCTQGSYRYPSRVYFSSLPFGIITTVKGDQNGVTTSFNVSDNRYLKGVSVDIRASDGTAITTNKAISDTQGRTGVTIATLGSTDLYGGDELWITGTYQAASQVLWDPQEDWFAVGENDGEGINRLIRLGDYLYIFKPSSVWRYSKNNLINITADDDGLGAVSGKSVAKSNTKLIFLSKYGFYMISGNGQMQNISGKIDNLINDIDWSTASNAVAWSDRENYYCYMPTITIKNADESTKRTLSNAVFVYNLRQQAWSILTGITVKNATSFIESGATNYYIGSSSGYVYRAFNGNKDQTGASAYTEIPFELETKDYYLGTPDEYFQFNSVFPIVDVSGGIAMQYSIDGGAYKDFVRAPTTKDDPQKLRFPDNSYGRKIKFKFKLNSKNLAKIKGFVLYFENKEPEFYVN